MYQLVSVGCCELLMVSTYGGVLLHVLQSVLSSEGVPMDVDVVLNEMLETGDEVFVEYGDGPEQYTCVRRFA